VGRIGRRLTVRPMASVPSRANARFRRSERHAP
jgi:hypothetical protein